MYYYYYYYYLIGQKWGKRGLKSKFAHRRADTYNSERIISQLILLIAGPFLTVNTVYNK